MQGCQSPIPGLHAFFLNSLEAVTGPVAVDEIIWVKNPPFSSYHASFTIKVAWFHQHIQKNFI